MDMHNISASVPFEVAFIIVILLYSGTQGMSIQLMDNWRSPEDSGGVNYILDVNWREVNIGNHMQEGIKLFVVRALYRL